jgi:branched-chain amino acid transport system permease protein
VGLVVVLAWVLYLYLHAQAYTIFLADIALLAAIGAVALNILVGYAGQLAISSAAFMGIGGYTVVMLDSKLGSFLTVVVAVVVSGIIGAGIAIPSLRLRGMYLVFSTLSLHFVALFVFRIYDTHTSGAGGHVVASASFFGWHVVSERAWLVLLSVVVALVYIFARALIHGPWGRAWSAIRQSDLAAAIAGVPVARSKVQAFVVSACLTGLQGALLAYVLGLVSSDYYSLDLAISFVAMIIVGGLASLWGSFLGALLVTFLPQFLNQFAGSVSSSGSSFLATNVGTVSTGIYGLLVLATIVLRPTGIAGMAAFGGLSRWSHKGRPRNGRLGRGTGAPAPDVLLLEDGRPVER